MTTEEYHELSHGKDAARFEKSGFPDKLAMLREQYGLAGDHEDCLLSINNARNCLVHRRGVVGEKDCTRDGEMVIQWLHPTLDVRSADGTVTDLQFPRMLDAGDEVRLEVAPDETSFRLGEHVALATDDLLCLWWTLRMFAGSLVESVRTSAHAKGFYLEGETTAPAPAGDMP